MTAFVKPMLMSALGVSCLAIAGTAQMPTPFAPPPPPESVVGLVGQPAPVAVARPTPPATVRVLGDQGGTYRFAPGTAAWSGNEARVLFGFAASAEDAKAAELTRKLLAAKSDDEKDKLRDQIKAALDKAFSERQKAHEEQIKGLEEQLKKLKKMVSDRQDAKAEIIADRMKQLEKDAKGLGW
jgi:hypothetical protein